MHRAWLPVLALAALSAPARAQAPRASLAERVDRYVAPYVRIRDFSGVVLVMRQGQPLVRRAYGLASYELGTPNVTATRFGIGSVSKTFTAAAVELLAQRGQLALGDTLSKYVPGLAWGDSVTIEQLLAHSAGVPDYYGWPEYAARRGDPVTLEDFARLAGAKPLDFRPGSSSRYSSSGYALLALVVERVAHTAFSAFMRTELLTPLHLARTGDLEDDGLVPGLASGYDPSFPPALVQPGGRVGHGWLEGHGSMYASAADLAAWAVAARSLVRRSSLAYPYGWGVTKRFGRDVIEQTGRVPIGYASYLGIYPADSLVVVVLSNIQSQAAFQIGPDVAAIVLGQPYRAPAIRAAAPTAADSTRLERLAGRYQVFPGFVLTVRATGRGLLLAGPEGAFLPLDAEGGDRFFFRPLYVPIAFRVDSSGVASALLWEGTQACPRVP